LPVWRNLVNPTIGRSLSMTDLGNPQFGRSHRITEFGDPTILSDSYAPFLRTTLLHIDRYFRLMSTTRTSSEKCPALLQIIAGKTVEWVPLIHIVSVNDSRRPERGIRFTKCVHSGLNHNHSSLATTSSFICFFYIRGLFGIADSY